MIHKTISLDELKALVSFDHGCLVEDLPLSSYQAMKHRDVLEELRQSMDRLGVITPLRVVDTHLVDGHHRALVIMELGIEEVPVTYEGRLE